MFILLVAVMLAGLLLQLAPSEPTKYMIEERRALTANRVIDQYRLFNHVAAEYMANMASVPAGTKIFYSTLKTRSDMPPAVLNQDLQFADKWYAKALAGGNFVVCTEMEEDIRVVLERRIQSDSIYKLTKSTATGRYVLADKDWSALNVDTEAISCN